MLPLNQKHPYLKNSKIEDAYYEGVMVVTILDNINSFKINIFKIFLYLIVGHGKKKIILSYLKKSR